MRRTIPIYALLGTASSIQVDFTNDDSIKQAASTVAYGLLKYYTGNNTGDVAGNLPAPYYWWEAGAMFGTLIDYWFYTGDETYVNVTTQAMLHQVGDNADYMPANQTKSEGNDDQGFWAMAALSAAENKFPNPPPDQPQWLALAQAVFNEYVSRWDPATCNGGIRWQIFTFNNGWDYKNSISNGCFFNVAARLARYTGNQTYADWAEKIYDWVEQTKFIDADYNIWDGAGTDGDCSSITRQQWTYNAGIYLHGASIMLNVTKGNDTWAQRTVGLANRTAHFFFNNSGIAIEPACEVSNTCDLDELSFKGHLMRWMAVSSVMAPSIYDTLMPLVRSTAEAAAMQCSGSPPADQFKGQPGTACGFKWTQKGTFDGLVGVGQQMNALSAIQYNLVKKGNSAQVPATSTTGGTSNGNVNAGVPAASKLPTLAPITTGDRVAAGFLTTAVLLGVLGGSFFVLKE
ncbi:cell wall glycosyl hydrolase [Xylaria intraflava]|nr:cell wall glycosyl hydrolase [Xylaria intraflava]